VMPCTAELSVMSARTAPRAVSVGHSLGVGNAPSSAPTISTRSRDSPFGLYSFVMHHNASDAHCIHVQAISVRYLNPLM